MLFPKNKYKFGVIGLGHISPYYISAINRNPHITIAAFCDKNNQIELSQKNSTPFYTDYKMMLEKEKLDAVIILTPNHAHFEIAAHALSRQVNVLCEKPMGKNLEESERIISLANAKNVIALAAFHRRYNKHVQKLKNSMELRCGLQSIHVRYLENIVEHSGGETWYFDPKKSGGGCVIDNGINVFDLILDFVTNPIVESAQLIYDENGTDMKADINLVDKITNVTMVVNLDWNSKKEIKDIVIETRAGRLSVDMLSGFPLFKESLWHEYQGVVDDFANLLTHKHTNFIDTRSLKAMRLVGDVYKKTKIERCG